MRWTERTEAGSGHVTTQMGVPSCWREGALGTSGTCSFISLADYHWCTCVYVSVCVCVRTVA